MLAVALTYDHKLLALVVPRERSKRRQTAEISDGDRYFVTPMRSRDWSVFFVFFISLSRFVLDDQLILPPSGIRLTRVAISFATSLWIGRYNPATVESFVKTMRPPSKGTDTY